MLREDKNAKVESLGAFFLRWEFVSGKVRIQVSKKKEHWNQLLQAQMVYPIKIPTRGRRTWWWFKNRFYWEEEALTEDDVHALLLEREKRKERQLVRARMSVKLDKEPVMRRDPIPLEVQKAVWERDGGKCVQCGSSFNIQYDHIIPFSMGGASSMENLQILCAECNREKGASFG